MSKSLHELSKEMLNKANVEVLTETGKLKKEEAPKVVEESMKKSPLHAGPKVDVKKMDAVGSKIAKIRGTKGAKVHATEGVNGEHGPDDDEEQLDRIERKKQKEPPFEPDKKPSSNWTSAKNKAKNLARAAMKKQVEKKKVNEDKIKPDSKIKVAGKYLFGNTKGNVAHIEGGKTKKLTKEDDSEEAKRTKEARGKGKKTPYLPFGKKEIERHSIAKPKLTEAELAELSKEKVKKYRSTSHLEIGKAAAHRTFAMHTAKHNPSPENEKKYQDAKNTVRKRIRGETLAKKKLVKMM